MGLPRPNPFGNPLESPEQFLSDYLLHASVAAGTVIGVYVYTGLYSGPGITGTIYMAMFSTAEVGAAGAGSVAFADTAYAMSVYAEPFVAAGRFIVRKTWPALVIGGAMGLGSIVNRYAPSPSGAPVPAPTLAYFPEAHR